MIIVEGPDHVGKTTFCHKLVDELHAQGVTEAAHHHMSKPGPDFDYFKDYVKGLKMGHVYDRFHYGAFVYGLMLDLHSTKDYSVSRMRLITRFIHSHGGIVILIVDGDHKEYEKRIRGADRKEMFKPGPILESNIIFPWFAFVDEPDMLIDIQGGTNWPSDTCVNQVVNEWRLSNGFA